MISLVSQMAESTAHVTRPGHMWPIEKSGGSETRRQVFQPTFLGEQPENKQQQIAEKLCHLPARQGQLDTDSQHGVSLTFANAEPRHSLG